MGDPNQLAVRCSVNGELWQNSNTADLIFGCQRRQQFWLKEGDTVTVEVAKLGCLTNTHRRRG